MVNQWIVSNDCSGDFTTVQDAVNAVPEQVETRTLIFIKNGVYKEKLNVPKNKRISFIGENQLETVITYDDYARKIAPDGQEYGTFRTASVTIEADDFYAENLTFENSAGHGPEIGQALALTVSGDRNVCNRVRLLGNQDTLYTPGNGRHYFKDCYIEGHVDFIFGPATAVFEKCQIHSLRKGYITAASTPKDQLYGFVFFDCNLTGSEQNTVYLGRPWRPFANVIYVRTWMDNHIKPEGWHNWRNEENERTARYTEFGSSGPGANPEARLKWAKTFAAEASGELTPQIVLAGLDHWEPTKIATIGGWQND
ncbi:MAG: hypothetical protein JWN30_1040 [Bacilli bacterium]|nr:hypothetical protein [Bacilli bacterium]